MHLKLAELLGAVGWALATVYCTSLIVTEPKLLSSTISWTITFIMDCTYFYLLFTNMPSTIREAVVASIIYILLLVSNTLIHKYVHEKIEKWRQKKNEVRC